jgi:hypothetical protein
MLSSDKWPVAKDADETRVVRNVKTHGCHITTVAFDLDYDTPDYVHSVGFYARFDQPEVIVMGVSAQTGGRAVNELNRRFATGLRIQNGDLIAGLFEGRDALVSSVDVTDASAYIDWLLWFYTAIRCDFPLVQILWPDKQGRFPSNPDCHPSVRKAQLLRRIQNEDSLTRRYRQPR